MNRRNFLRCAAATAMGAMMRSTPVHASYMQDALLTRNIPSSGEAIPAVGLGTWRSFMPEQPHDLAALAPLEEVLRLFHESGGRVLDTAPSYGAAEQVAGTLMKKLNITDDLWLATKVSSVGKDASSRQMNESFQKLARQKIELMQIHNLVDWKTNLALIREWKQQGRFKYIGVTHLARTEFEELESIVKTEKVDFVQLPYSVGMRGAAERLIPAARDAGVAVLVMRPFEGGNIFDKVRDRPLPESVRAYAGSWSESFLKFILANEAITAVIPATRNPEHLKSNMRAGVGRFPNARERDELVKLLEV